MRVGISGAHGTGKSTLISNLCELLAGHEAVPEPYELLEDEHHFAFPPTVSDYRLQFVQATQNLLLPGPRLIFDRTPLDFLAYLEVTGHPVEEEASTAALAPLFASLDALIIVPVTAEIAARLPEPELPELRDAVNEALLRLAYDDPLEAWSAVPIVELDVPVDKRAEIAARRLQRIHE